MPFPQVTLGEGNRAKVTVVLGPYHRIIESAHFKCENIHLVQKCRSRTYLGKRGNRSGMRTEDPALLLFLSLSILCL